MYSCLKTQFIVSENFKGVLYDALLLKITFMLIIISIRRGLKKKTVNNVSVNFYKRYCICSINDNFFHFHILKAV